MAKRGRPPRKNRAKEIITRQTSIDNMRLMDNLPDPDRVLEKLGQDPDDAFKDIMSDDHLTSVMGSRQASLKGMNWDITIGKSSDQILKACQDMLTNLNRNHNGMGIDRAVDDILQANPWGMSALEPIWQRGVNEWIPIALKGRPFRYFTFDAMNELRFLSSEDSYNGVEIPDKSIILARHWITSNSFENPYGDKLLSKSYWPVTFKRNGMQWYNVFLEKYGMPWIIGKVPTSKSETNREEFADVLAQAVADGVIIITNDDSVEFQEASGKADSGKIYTDMFHYMDSALSKIWLGETLTTEMGDVGSYAASKTHQGVKDERRDQDKRMVESSFQTLIDWFVELNFGDVPSPVFKMIAPLGVNQELANRDKVLSETGVKFSSLYYQKKYGFEEEDFEIKEDAEPAPAFGKFAKPAEANAQNQIEVIKNDLDPKELQKQMNGILKPVIELIGKSGEYKDLMKKLTSIYPDMDSSELEAELLKAYNLSDTIGRLPDAQA